MHNCITDGQQSLTTLKGKLLSGMAGETILDLSLTASVPGGNPAIAVTAPLTRPSAADFDWQSDQGW
jgi:hypothetical protein